MAANTFSFEDGLGPTAESAPLFVPADRTSKQPIVPTASSKKSDVRGELPQDMTILQAIKASAEEFGVPVEFGLALAQQESGYRLDAHNDEYGADGPFQFIPSTAQAHGLKYGVDTRDIAKSSRAAMKDFAEQMAVGGIDWAIKHHFAGPNTSGHGPKTAQYLADVSKRAEEIRGLLGSVPETLVQQTTTKTEDSPAANATPFSFEEALGTPDAPAPKVAVKEKSLSDQAWDFLENSGNIIGNSVSTGWDFLKQRLQDAPDQFMGEQMQMVEIPVKDEEGNIVSTQMVRAARRPIEEENALLLKKAGVGAAPPQTGFWANIENPVKLFTEDSLPANFVETLSNSPNLAFDKFMEARKIQMQENIVANPHKYPAVSVQAAKQAIALRTQKQDPGVRELWTALKTAATTDPGKFGAQFANALMADPEMILAPQGLGLRVLSGTKKVVAGAEVVSRTLKIADKVIDAGTTGAALNLAIEGTAAASEGREMSASEAQFSAGMGFIASGAFAAIFSRGARARERLAKGDVNADTLQSILDDVAKEDVAIDHVLESKVNNTTKHRIEEITGVKFESEADMKSYLETTRKEWKKLFEKRDLNGQYQKALAEQKLSYADTRALEQGRAKLAAERDAAKAAEVETAWQKNQAERSSELNENYEQALAARDAAKEVDIKKAYAEEQKLKKITSDLDAQEIFEAAWEGDVPQIKQAMNRAARRDSNLATPKWQRGEVDHRLVVRLGIGSLFAGTAFAVAPEEQKLKAAFAGGLAGLLVPGVGGNVRTLGKKLSQMGAISPEGDVIGLLVKQGKMQVGKTADEAAVAERELLSLAKEGNQPAYKELYTNNYPKIRRYVRNTLGQQAMRLGVDADDVAQEVFVKAFQNLDKFKPDAKFSTWLHTIARNEVIDTLREMNASKAGGDLNFVSADMPDVRTEFGESYSKDVFDEGAGAEIYDTPEAQVVRQQTEQQLLKALDTLTPAQRESFLMNRAEQFTAQEIADFKKIPLGTVLGHLRDADAKVTKYLSEANSAVPAPRGPKSQRGEIDQKLLKTGGVVALGAAAGAYLNDENKLLGATIGALAGGALLARGRKGVPVVKQIREVADYTLGITSTRIMNKSKPLWRRATEHERVVLRDTHKHMKEVDPFLVKLQKLPKETNAILSRAILTGKAEVTNRLLRAIDDPELTKGWTQTKSTLNSLKDQLIALKRFAPNELDYFPRVVKDVEGLLKAMGKERGSYLEQTLKEAETKTLRNRGTGLTDLEKSLIINRTLAQDRIAGQQPGFAKNRGVEEITPELQQYYASPTESLHSYIRSAVEDIERAKFFGKDLEVIKKGSKEYTNVDTSIGNLVNKMINDGTLTGKDAEEVAGLLRSRFLNGERAPAELIQASKNLSYAGLLGNPFSAVTQLGDVIIQAYTQDLRSTLSAVVRNVTGRKIVNMKDFGLSDHVAEEFASTSSTAKALNKIFKYSLFKGVDEFGKDVALNAAVIRFGRLAKSEGGIRQIASRYADALNPGEFEQLIKDLHKGDPTDLVRSIAFAELTRTQPVTRLELPQAYLDNPNGRLLYQYKTFMLKQIDLARRDGFEEIKKGNIAKGLRNLTELGIVMGVAGTATDKLKDFFLGKDVDLKASDIPMNMFKTFGLSKFFMDQFFGVDKAEAAQRRKDGDKKSRTVPARPIQAIVNTFAPPVKMFDDILRADPKAVRYLPFVGPYLYENYVATEKKK
jgi:RNA polymerase sigma-70 factor (ECF subfamily)